jgi:hypothetical protein
LEPERATDSIIRNEKVKNILIGQRERRIIWRGHREYWRVASGNTCRHPIKY